MALDTHHETVLEPSSRRIARVYAEALLNSAEKRGIDGVVTEQLDSLVQDVFKLQPRLETLLSSAAVRRDEKERILRSALGRQANELFLDFLMVLNRHDRLDLLRSLWIVYHEMRDQRMNRVRVTVRSATPLDDGQRHHILEQLRIILKREPVLQVLVDAELLGGLVIQVGDWLYDGSVRTQLERIRNQLLTRSSHEIQSRRDRFSS
jgi:F-type H+-transporting ATPase subunit delta